MVNICDDLEEKVDNMHKKMGNFSKQMESIFLSQMEKLKILK